MREALVVPGINSARTWYGQGVELGTKNNSSSWQDGGMKPVTFR